MTEFIMDRTGKLLFPHSPRGVRRHRMSRLMLVLAAIVSGNAMLVYCMVRGWR